MIERNRVPGRLATGAKMFVALLAAAALPAWALGQGDSKPKPDAKPEIKVIELKDLQIIPNDFEADFFKLLQAKEAQPKPGGEAKSAIDARIAELTRLLEDLKAAKAAAEKARKHEAPKPEGERKVRTIIIGADGKIIESKEAPLQLDGTLELQLIGPDGKNVEPKKADPKTTPKVEWKVLPAQPQPGQPFRIVIGTDAKDGKTEPKPPLSAEKQLEEVRRQLERQLDSLRKAREQPQPMIFSRLVAPNVYNPGVAKVINLTRATYNLPKEKAEALTAFLKAHIKASVLETKMDAEGLTVTTTPDVQSTVGGLVGLMQSRVEQPRLLIRPIEQPK